MSVQAQICIANISTRERRRRLLGGALSFVISLAILAILLVAGEPRWWRAALVFTFWGAAVGYFQWRDRT